MPNDRERIVMLADEVAEFLRAGRTAVLVTLAADGTAEPVGMWYVVDDDGAVLMRTYARSQKAVNLRRDPRCSVLVECGERYAELRGVRLSGVVELDDDPDLVVDVWTGLALKYEGLAAEHVEAFREVARSRAAKQVVLRLRPARVVSWDHRKLSA